MRRAVLGLAFAVWAAAPAAADDVAAARSTMATLDVIGLASTLYMTDHGAYPDADDIEALCAALEPDYATGLPRTDGWQRPLEASSDGQHLELRSVGRDGRRDDGPPAGAAEELDADIVWADGGFRQWPVIDSGG